MSLTTDNVFQAARQEGDPNLVDEITALLTKAGHPQPKAWLRDPVIFEASTASPKLQQFLINRYWRIQLGTISENTSAERYCLLDDSSPADYLKVFEGGVVPAIVRHGLPHSA